MICNKLGNELAKLSIQKGFDDLGVVINKKGDTFKVHLRGIDKHSSICNDLAK